MINGNLIVSSSPHVRSKETVDNIMRDVVIALIPALIAGVLFFGFRALIVTLVCIFSCIVGEYVWEVICKKPITTDDYSAIVTGILLAFNMPVTVPLWIPVIGGLFAIIIVKQLFGGLGQNFMNPALAARAFLLASWPTAMTKWVQPFTRLPLLKNVDVISSATPLALIKGTEGAGQVMPDYANLFLGNIGGCIGETSALALLLGGLYLIYKKVINWRIPVSFIGTVFILTLIFGKAGFFTEDPVYHILSGGLMLGAIFMATDYASSPVTPKGQIIMGLGCGIITTLIRLWGGYPEGVSYSILLMNVVTPLIDRYTAPTIYGEVKTRG
jgi:electron transport complex protein RnfD